MSVTLHRATIAWWRTLVASVDLDALLPAVELLVAEGPALMGPGEDANNGAPWLVVAWCVYDAAAAPEERKRVINSVVYPLPHGQMTELAAHQHIAKILAANLDHEVREHYRVRGERPLDPHAVRP